MLCYGLFPLDARVVPGENRCLVTGQGSCVVILEFLGEHDRGGGVALVRRPCHRLVLAQHFLRVHLAGEILCRNFSNVVRVDSAADSVRSL